MLSQLDNVVHTLYDAVNRSKDVNMRSMEVSVKPSIHSLIAKYTTDDKTSENNSQSICKCRPWNHQDYLDRLHTFQMTSDWFAKHDIISPPECALRGWCSNGRDKLICKSCDAQIEHNKDDESGAILQASLTSQHVESCGWRSFACDKSFVDLQETNPLTLNNQLLLRLSNSLDALIQFKQANNNSSDDASAISIAYDDSLDLSAILTCFNIATIGSVDVALFSVNQLQAIAKIMRDIVTDSKKIPTAVSTNTSSNSCYVSLLELLHSRLNDASSVSVSNELIVLLLILTLFGWEIVSKSIDNSTNAITTTNSNSININTKTCLQCAYCMRSVSLPQKPSFDIVKQHKTYCPYVRTQSGGEGVCGWQTGYSALTDLFEYVDSSAVANNNNNGKAKRVSSNQQSKLNISDVNGAVNSADENLTAEQAYKRIKCVLNNTL